MRRLSLLALLVIALPTLAFERQSNADYRARRERLAAKLGQGVAILFAPMEEEGQNATRGFRQNDNFYYLTGYTEPGAGLVIAGAQGDRPYTEILFLPQHNVSQEKWTGPKLAAGDANAEQLTGFARVAALDTMRDELVRILPQPRATVFTAISEDGPTPSTNPIQWLRRANTFPNYVGFSNVTPLINELRMIKDAGEIALIRKAVNGTVAAHQAALRAIKPNMPENELAGVIEYEFRRSGAEGPSFSSIVGSGLNSTVLHYASNSGTMKDGDLVVVDIGSEYSMYASDVTRTLPVNGKFTPRQREIYDIVLAAQQAAVNSFKAGVSTVRNGDNSLHKAAFDYINTHGKDRSGNPLGTYFIHGTTHHVGLAVHDPGDQNPLQPGMVFTIEPGIYIPEEGFGVRIEDTYLVRADGTLDCLSCGAPKDPATIERIIQQ
ncbi:MAG TPA: Xaa-Pro peptidase family protein [Thermoanaerobaculia bacterium]